MLEMSESRMKEKLEGVKEIADELIKYMNLADRLTTELVADEGCDPELRIGNCGCTIIATPVFVKDIHGKSEVEGFVIGHGVVVPGVHYYKDGSGEPDTYDFAEIKDVTDARTAAFEGIKHAFDMMITEADTLYAENKMFEEWEREKENKYV